MSTETLRSESELPERHGTLRTRREWLLAFIPSLAAAGPLLPVFGPLYAFRLAVVCYVAAVAVTLVRRSTPAGAAAPTVVGRATTWTAFLWLATGVLGLVWASDLRQGIRDLLAVGFGLALVMAVQRAGRADRVLRALAWGWVLSFAVTSVVALLELTVHLHMTNYVMAPYLAQGRGEELTASTFGNPNLYALYLAMGVPLLLYLIAKSRSRSVRAGHTALVLALLVLLLYSGGRLGMAATAISIVLWLVLTRRALRSMAGLVVLAGLAVVIVAGVWRPLADAAPGAAPPAKMSKTSLAEVEPSSAPDAAPNSGNVRVNLTRDGFDMITSTRGRGVGPGNFPVWLREHNERFPVGGVVSPHNALLELTTQYGVVPTVSAAVMFVLAVFAALRRGLRPHGPGAAESTLVLMMALPLPLYAVTSSTFWTPPTTWVALAIFLLAASVSDLTRSAERPTASRAPGAGHTAAPA